MAIPTSRTKEVALISVDSEKCNGCGLCAIVCKDFSLVMENGKAVTSNEPAFGCFACGQCMAICPTEAIKIEGRFLTPADIFKLPPKSEKATHESLFKLLQSRRSTRDFKEKEVSPQLIHEIIRTALTAPMGVPPSDVSVLVINGKEKVRKFSEDFCNFLEKMQWMSSKWFLTLMRPFLGKETDELFRSFMRPLMDKYISEMKKGNNYVTYDAPVVMYFYGSPYSDPADPIVSATYAMIAAESMGLGSCMLGAIHPFIQSGKAARKFREKWNIRYKSREGLFLILGYPKIRFQKGIKRSFANMDVLS